MDFNLFIFIEKKDWLESLHVTTEGKIITPDKRLSISQDLLLQKRNRRQSEKDKEERQKNVIRNRDAKLVKEASIFDDVATSQTKSREYNNT